MRKGSENHNIFWIKSNEQTTQDKLAILAKTRIIQETDNDS